MSNLKLPNSTFYLLFGLMGILFLIQFFSGNFYTVETLYYGCIFILLVMAFIFNRKEMKKNESR